MQIVYTLHAVHFQQVVYQRFDVNVIGCAFEQNIDRLTQDSPRVPQDEQADQNTDKRVEPVPLREEDDDARNDRAYRRKYIAHQMDKRASQVQVMLTAALDEPCCPCVDEKGEGSDSDEDGRINFGRGEEASPRFVKDPQGDQNQRGRVDEGDENPHAMISESFTCVCGLGRNADCVPTQTERDHVGEVMRGIGEQGEAVGEKARDGFDDDERESYSQRKRKTFCGVIGEVAEMRMCMLFGHV